MRDETKFPPELEKRLKRPWGKLIRGSYEETAQRIKEVINKEKPEHLITVGDAVTRNLVANNIHPKLMIIDNKIMRSPIESSDEISADEEIVVENPPGTISEDSLRAIQRAIASAGKVKIIVKGEEDLLTAAAALWAPEKSIIVYGQPNEGIVIVKVTAQLKAEAEEIVKAVRELRKTK